MLILTIRTDKPEAEIGLFDDEKQLTYEIWTAHRQLAETIHDKLHALLDGQNKAWNDVQAIVCFQGPGSFTGLRIGLSVGNALAATLSIPIKATCGETWAKEGINGLLAHKGDHVVLPNYGSEVHITPSRK